MKKIIVLLLSIFMLVSCGKKEYEQLSKRDILLIEYKALKKDDPTAFNIQNEIISYLNSKKDDENAVEQLKIWDKVLSQLSNISYTTYKPELNEVFGDPNNGVDYHYRLYKSSNIDEKTEKNIMYDIVTDNPFDGIAVLRDEYNGTILEIRKFEKGVAVETLMSTTYYENYWFNPPIKSHQYFKNGKVYKELFYSENGDFKEEILYKENL